MALKVLRALDKAKVQYYHFKAIVIAGMGMFTDAYDLFCFPPVMTLIGRIYYDRSDNKIDNYDVSPVAASTMWGIVYLGTAIGQVVSGFLGDRVGRKRVYGFALVLMVAGSIGCGFSVGKSRSYVLASLGFFRFVMGVGIGGDYPLSATIMSEFANQKTRGAFIAAVFSMQGFGILGSSVVTMAVCQAFNKLAHNPLPGAPTPTEADLAWRVILMAGAVPAVLTFYWRMMMPETARYTALVAQDAWQAAKDMERVLDVPLHEITGEDPFPNTHPTSAPSLQPPSLPSYRLFSRTFLHHHGIDLFASSVSWFLVDVVFYSSNLFQSRVYESYLPKPENLNAFQAAYRVARLQALVALCSTIPGYFFTVALIDRIGRIKIQSMGFFFMAVLFISLAIHYDHYQKQHTDVVFLLLYGSVYFFANFGPNTTTFIIPAELFPARFRASCNGIAGAIGKLGAILGAIGFVWATQEKEHNGYHKKGLRAALLILGSICLGGLLVTIMFTKETMGRSLEENETSAN
ncbi:hypothetical protein MLD38_000841 [Melastoma candidum]|uniref:Uncharacterized protein n=1 Tax=Melastoma candidum TaxID=119954 RepID=A0ACB9SC94_9MYRT|nr:hypothetical protein MLD38_000841 [Melastoma candidum]